MEEKNSVPVAVLLFTLQKLFQLLKIRQFLLNSGFQSSFGEFFVVCEIWVGPGSIQEKIRKKKVNAFRKKRPAPKGCCTRIA